MSNRFGAEALRAHLAERPHTWVVTGSAGFIGSHLAERLLREGQRVVGLDDFSTGSRENLAAVERAAGARFANFRFVEGDIRNPDACRSVCAGADYVLHEAALGSVPRSIEDPITSTEVNVNGTLNVLLAARDAGVKRVVYASSSSVYGDNSDEWKREDRTGAPLSPYAATKAANELYARIFPQLYGVWTVGLRYFNVFGPRQDPNGPYAAVIPRWLDAMRAGRTCVIYGDGETARDFCFVENVVEANLLAALGADERSRGAVFNIALGERTTLNELHRELSGIAAAATGRDIPPPVYEDFRAGDVRYSQADISMARDVLGYEPIVPVRTGLERTASSFLSAGGA